MTRDDIIKMAREAKLPHEYDTGRVVHLKELERFAALVAAAEREACARVCADGINAPQYPMLSEIAAAIRARGKYGSPWVPVTERLPKPGKFVLAVFRYSTGKQQVIRAMHAPPKTLSEEDYGEFLTDPDYDEATDTTYWPEGWYECNENEETHWQVHEEVTHWMPLPEVPQA